jgi:hypothetical protein
MPITADLGDQGVGAGIGRVARVRALRGRVAAAGGTVRDLDATSFAVSGLDGSAIGALALRAGVELHELAPVRRSLEDAFMELTAPGAQRAPAPARAVPADLPPVRPGSPPASGGATSIGWRSHSGATAQGGIAGREAGLAKGVAVTTS